MAEAIEFSAMFSGLGILFWGMGYGIGMLRDLWSRMIAAPED